ncbi:MAG TPA: hypothetical protein VN905_13295 [Candidatus Binatia bacterium]|nr:hypothetical protein [Candidatus Binatia bacterium]
MLLICAGAAERAGAESAAPTPNGDDILLKARQVWDAQSYPTRIDYVVAVRVVQNGTAGTKHYAAEFAPASTDLHVTAASNETLANPEPPHGITVRITREARGQKSLSIPVNPEGPADYLGVPLLFPTYSFGLAHPRGLVVEPSPAPVADSAAPGVIGTVVARTRTYLVTCLGEEDYGQGRAFHLVLRPVRDPGRYRLRELWVDAARYSTLKAVVEGNFADGPGTRVNWMVTFHTVDGAQYIDTETAVGPLKLGPSQKFDEASISFESIQAHHGMPPARFMFEQLPIRNALMEPKS